MSEELPAPIENGDKRAPNGRFLPGCKGGTGNPYAKRMAQLRASIYYSVGEQDVKEIMNAMINAAKKGDVQAAKLALAYIVGDPQKMDPEDKINLKDLDVLDMIPRDKLLELAK